MPIIKPFHNLCSSWQCFKGGKARRGELGTPGRLGGAQATRRHCNPRRVGCAWTPRRRLTPLKHWLLGSWDILSCLRILQISMLRPHLPASLVNQFKGVARVLMEHLNVHTNRKNKFQKTPKAVMFFLLIFLVLCIWTYLFSTCLLIESSVIFGFCDPEILGSHSACGIQLPYSQVI